jgi:hypothetical protein
VWERMIFTNEDEMRATLERLLRDFPNVILNQGATPECPWQTIVNLGIIDKPTFLAWAITTQNLIFCSSLVLDLLEDPQPDWMRPVIVQFGNHLLE